MNPKNTLIVAPNAGFCNRLRTMVSAIYLAEKLGMNIEHLWIGTSYECGCVHVQKIHDKSFEYFFKETVNRCDYTNMKHKVNKVYTEWLPHNKFYPFQSYGQKLLKINVLYNLKLVNETMNASENFLIETSYINNLNINKEDKYNIYKKYFIPRDYFTNEINKISDTEKNMIGIHIRKGDFKIYFPETQIDDEKIIQWIDNIETKIVFCSDDKAYEHKMRQRIKNPVITTYDSNMDIDFLDFLLLSRCIKVYGTAKSSFSEEAAYFGNAEYIPLTQDFFVNT